MIWHYADTSALTRCYFADEPDHAELHDLLLQGSSRVVTSVVTRVEFGSAVMAAHRAGRIPNAAPWLNAFDAHCALGGPIRLVAFDPPTVLPAARQAVVDYAVRSIDAIHLAVATTTVRQLVHEHRATGPADADDESLVFVTRDEGQAAAAESLGLAVA